MKVCSYERHLYIITFSQCLSCQGAMNCVSKCMIVRACVQCSELCSWHLFLLPCLHVGKRVGAVGAIIGLDVVKIVMVMTNHQSAVATGSGVGGTKTQSAVATGSQAIHGSTAQPAVASGVGGTNGRKTQSAVATASQAINGSTTQPAVATGSQAIDGSDPSQL